MAQPPGAAGLENSLSLWERVRVRASRGDEKITNQPQNEGPDIFGAFLRSEIVSLSHSLAPLIPHWPGDPPVEFEQWTSIAEDGYHLRRFSMSEHAGTHLSAPASFYPGGMTVDEYPADTLVKSAVVIDVREQCQANPDYALTASDVTVWESRHGSIPSGRVVLLLTGWSQRWGNPAAYLGTDANGGLHFPGFGADTAALLVNERGASGLGTDTAGVEPGADSNFAVSRLVLSQPRIVLQNLAYLDRLPPTGALLIIGLLRLTGGSGSPAAVTAFLPPASGL